MRVAHQLKPNKGTTIPNKFIFFDSETYGVPVGNDETIHKPFLVWSVLWDRGINKTRESEEWRNFRKIKDFWDYVDSKPTSKRRIVLMSHNLEFDFKALAGYYNLKVRGWKIKTLIMENNAKILKFKKSGKSLLFLDNLNYFKKPLYKLGEYVNLPKLDIPIGSPHWSEWDKYCKRDVEILLALWKSWAKTHREENMGAFGKTLAGQGFNFFCHRQKEIPIYIHNHPKAIELERQGFFGGRTECFQKGDFTGIDIYQPDVNSMYPYVMTSFDYPTKLKGVVEKLTIEKLKDIIKKYLVICKVKVNTSIPCIPKRMKQGLCFPVGKFYTILNTPELKYALDYNLIKEVKETAIYEKGPIFKAPVNELYEKRLEARKEGNKGKDFSLKILMNSLFGKFGMKVGKWKVIAENTNFPDGVLSEYLAKEKRWMTTRCINGRVEEKMGEIEGFNSFTAIPSHITSYARIYLWDLITKAGKENVYYCDTDSLFVNEKGYNNLYPLIDSKKLGYLKLERVDNDIVIVTLKHYRQGERLVCKGIKNNAIQLNENEFIQDIFLTTKGALRRRNPNEMRTGKVKKRVTKEYKKGKVLKTGKITPFKLDEKVESIK